MLTRINQATKRRKGQRGFTLIELLLVVAILAVLAFLAVPAIASTIRNARLRTCSSNEVMIENTLYRWYADQVAAGETIVFTDTVFLPAGIGLQAWIDAAENLLTPAATGTIILYFTPASRIPQCPIDAADNVYLVLTTIGTDGGLEGVEVRCDGTGAGGTVHDYLRRLP